MSSLVLDQLAGLCAPCDEQGRALRCEAPNCKDPAKFRRDLPRRARKNRPAGDCYLKGSKLPFSRRPLLEVEVVCGVHLHDWTHGPITKQDLEDERADQA